MFLLLIIMMIIFYITSGGIRENVGSDWFHRGKLADINQYIQKQIADTKLRYMKENKEKFQIMKDTPIEKYNPNKYVISDYSFKTLKPKEDVELDKIQVGMLESEDFAKPVDYTEEKKLSEYLEVDKYDAGSGDMTELNKAYDVTKKNNYLQTTTALRLRGGNVYLYPKEKCDPKGVKNSIIGYL